MPGLNYKYNIATAKNLRKNEKKHKNKVSKMPFFSTLFSSEEIRNISNELTSENKYFRKYPSKMPFFEPSINEVFQHHSSAAFLQ